MNKYKELSDADTNDERHLLLVGPTGSGKSTKAREIYQKTKHNDEPLIERGCAELANNDLFEANLFGCLKGYATGTERKIGLVEAEGKPKDKPTDKPKDRKPFNGTIILDEANKILVYDKLYRALREGKAHILGETEEYDIKGRFIFTTTTLPDNLAKVFPDEFLSRVQVRLMPSLTRDRIIGYAQEFIPEYVKQCYGDQKISVIGITEVLLYQLLFHKQWKDNIQALKDFIYDEVQTAKRREQMLEITNTGKVAIIGYPLRWYESEAKWTQLIPLPFLNEAYERIKQKEIETFERRIAVKPGMLENIKKGIKLQNIMVFQPIIEPFNPIKKGISSNSPITPTTQSEVISSSSKTLPIEKYKEAKKKCLEEFGQKYWASFDSTQSNKEIAKISGVSAETVGKKRTRFSKPT